MAVVNLEATRVGVDAVPGKGEGPSVKTLVATRETNADDSATSTYSFGKIQSNARILGISQCHNDDLATAGAPTLDIGLFAVDSNITDDDDALTNGLDMATAGSNNVINDIANYGKEAWEHVNGQTSDPGGLLEVKGTLKDAAINQAGTLTLELYFAFD